MGMNVTEKILREHLVSGELVPGAEIGIRIDQALTQDATGTMAYLQFESMGLDRVRCERVVSYVDHNTIQAGPENADDHVFLRTAAARYGAVYSPPGNGICHQVHLERFGAPGKTLLGSDSHTPTAGALGMIAIGAGGIDVAVAMGGGAFHLTAPRVVRIELTGSLRPWVTAKDVILKVLSLFSTKGNVGCVFEYAGPALADLEVPERATIANMGAECGVTTSVFPSDAITREFLRAQGRGDAWRPLEADPDAVYDRTLAIDLSAIEPLAAAPHSPGNVVSVVSLAGTPVDQVLIGSCTNASYVDMKTVARLLAGRRVHPRVSLGVACGSRQVMLMLAREGLLADLLAAGARLLETACGFCIGNSLSPATGAVSLRTSNRNFEGRSGTPSGRVFLVSPSTAAMAALHGMVVDPTGVADIRFPKVRQPRAFDIDDSLFEGLPVSAGEPARHAAAEGGERAAPEIVRGPGIGKVPRNAPCPDRLDGEVTIKVGDRITTDHIMPAGSRLKYRSNVEKYAAFVFEGIDKGFAARAAANRDRGVHNVIVAGESYGQGSSREHAALCPMFLGVRAVVARSFERIHMANLVNFGIVPLLFAAAEGYAALSPGDRVRIDGLRDAVAGARQAIMKNETSGAEVALNLDLSERQRGILLAGGLLNRVLGEGAAAEARR